MVFSSFVNMADNVTNKIIPTFTSYVKDGKAIERLRSRIQLIKSEVTCVSDLQKLVINDFGINQKCKALGFPN